MKIKHYSYFFLFQVLVIPLLTAQFYNLPNDYSFSLLGEKQLARRDSAVHSGIKPYIHFFSKKYANVVDSHRIYKYVVEDPGVETAFFKHLISVEPKAENFKLHIDPLVNFEFGKDFADTVDIRPFTNTRGVIASAYIGNTVYVETMFAESQSRFPAYMNNYIYKNLVVPGQGRWKVFKAIGFDYAFSSGFVSVQPLKNLNIQAGHGKQKIGHGYRSLLLSDNAFNYPYARFTQQWFKGHLQYSNIYAVLTNLRPATIKPNPYVENILQKKAASFQYLSLNLHNSINVGFFQGMIWKAGDTRNAQELTWQYFNPLIFTNLPSYGFHNQNNILAGADLKIKITNKLNTYAQFMCDDAVLTRSISPKTGYQAGLNYFDVFGIKNLFVQAEYNNVNKDSYLSPATATTQSYFQYNEPLAYTPQYGQELILIGDYKYRRLFANVKYNYQDIRGSKYANLLNIKAGFVINTAYNLNVSVGYTYRNQNFYTFKTLNNETSYFYIGLRTTFYNLYYDF